MTVPLTLCLTITPQPYTSLPTPVERAAGGVAVKPRPRVIGLRRQPLEAEAAVLAGVSDERSIAVGAQSGVKGSLGRFDYFGADLTMWG